MNMVVSVTQLVALAEDQTEGIKSHVNSQSKKKTEEGALEKKSTATMRMVHTLQTVIEQNNYLN